MKLRLSFLSVLTAFVVGASGHCAFAQDNSASILCADGICRPAIVETTFFDRPAYQLTNGKLEVIVVPQIGRIMSFGKVGGRNLLWNAPTSAGVFMGYPAYGGDKSWLAPQSNWKIWHGSNSWPPDPAFDGTAHQAEVLSGGKLKMISPLSRGTGIRLERVMYFDERTGEFIVEQSAIKESGPPTRASIWNIAQVVPGEAVYLPLSPTSAYKNGFHWLSEAKSQHPLTKKADRVLKVQARPEGGGAKIGVDAPVSAIASVRGDEAFIIRSALPKGQYPDGAEGAGFPVELYINGDSNLFYIELELLSPLREFWVGSKWTHTLRWSLHDLPQEGRDETVARLLDGSAMNSGVK